VNLADLLPLATKIGSYLKSGVDQYAMLKASGISVTPDLIAAYLADQMADWHPEIKSRRLLDSDTRIAGARFLAGIASNFAKGT
jgi:hypothetical protein